MKNNLFKVLVSIVALALILSACATPTTEAPKPTDAPKPTAVPPTVAPTVAPTADPLGTKDKPIVITYVPSGDTAKIAKAGQEIADFLAKETGLSYKIEVGTSEAASIEAMGGNKAQVGFLNTFSIILAKKKYNIEVALVNLRIYGILVDKDKYAGLAIDPDKELAGKITAYYKGQFIAKKDSGIKTYADLKGKTFCFTSATSTSGNIIPRIILKANGIDPDKDLKASFAGGHDKAAIAVYNGDCVAGVTFVDTLTDSALNLKSKFPDIAEKVTQFAITDRIPNDGVQFTKDLSPVLKTKITDALMKMSKDPAGAKSLRDLYTIDGFEQAGYDKYYKPFEDVLAKAGVNAEDYVGKPK